MQWKRGEVLVGFADKGGPVAYTCDHVTGMDVVEVVFRPGPVFAFAVIDLEADVVGYPTSSTWIRSALLFNILRILLSLPRERFEPLA